MTLLNIPAGPELLYRIPALLIAIVFHEYAHAWVAGYFGDTTPREEKRLSLNPINHLDPIGMLVFWLTGFGWARPVRVDPSSFKNNDKEMVMALIGIAGPLANIIIAIVSFVVLRIFYNIIVGTALMSILVIIILFNLYLALFNMIPIFPLDGSRIVMWCIPRSIKPYYIQLAPYSPLILIVLIMSGAVGQLIYPVAEGIYIALEYFVFLI